MIFAIKPSLFANGKSNGQPSEEFGICLRVTGDVRRDRIEPKAVHALAQPERHDIADLAPHGVAAQVQIRHSAPEPRFVVPFRAFERRVAVAGFSCEMVIVAVLAVRRIRVPALGQFAEIVRSSLEPFVVIRRVVQNQVQIHADAPLVAIL